MMAHKRRYKEHVLDDLRQPSKATKYRRITESENYFKCRDRGSYKKYLNCPSSHKEKRRVSTELSQNAPHEGPLTESASSQTAGLQHEQDTQNNKSSEPDSEAAWRQSHLVQVMELPSTSDQDRPWTHISGDQPDIKMLTELQDISWTQPEENKSVPTADQHEPNKKVWQDISWTQPEENMSFPTPDQQEPNEKVSSFYFCMFSIQHVSFAIGYFLQ
ncbi:uncharacterized protein LOC113092849 [Carassius auratus]|uniref:Uncharacterized protein LOC113080363 n=1 Tax=Carassius auratus TaxID=7957 RepID=A0A6P6NIM9_CARAU|nr:uncharacterized protein LOC113080363 [Carassius auratus]XP_026114399.1 uncharacterized protein LOC113092849 [Carassius auratus]